MKKKFYTALVVLFIGIAVLLSCKKERSCTGCNENKPPIALAGPDQVITLPTDSISLDGSASSDPDGTISGWFWKKTSGPASFKIINTATAKTIVRNLDTGVYRFELIVTDKGGLTARDTMQLTVNPAIPINHPPVAKAGADQTITLPVNTTTLNGSTSTDPDNNITTYAWAKISGPSFFNILNADVAQTQVANLVEGVYQFELTVTDAGGLMAKDTVQVTVNGSPLTETDRDIYLAGSEFNGIGIQVAKYWKNAVAVPLTDGTRYAEATSITVVGSDIYVAGYETNASNNKVAKYWKNGVPISLSDGTKYAHANSIIVVGSDIYIAGYETNAKKVSVAKYWKNGIAVPLTNGIDYAVATDMAIIGNDVYISGTDGKFAKYWKNGQEFTLNDGTKSAVANAIAVAGSDIYVAGEDTDGGTYEIKYWKNGIAVSLNRWGENASATSIAVVDGNVHVAGFSDGRGGATGIAKYWKNGQEFGLGDGTKWAEGNSLAIVGSDVYVAGTENGVAKYWKNGQAVSVTDGTKSARAASIVVIKH